MREYFCAYHSMYSAMRKLSDAECGRLFRALLLYSSGEQPNNLQGREELLFDVFSQQIDRDAERYKAKCETNKANGSGRKRTQANGSGRGQEKEKEKEEELPPTPFEGETPDGGGRGYVEKHLGMLSPKNWEELRSYLEDGVSMELIHHAVDEACAQRKRTWAYARRILDRYVISGIETVEQAKTSDQKPQEQPKPKTRKEKYTAVVKGELVEFEREVPA